MLSAAYAQCDGVPSPETKAQLSHALGIEECKRVLQLGDALVYGCANDKGRSKSFAMLVVQRRIAAGICDDVELLGCTFDIACNFDSLATIDDGSCDFYSCLIVGCTDADACNYSPEANLDSGACLYDGECDEVALGCTYEDAQNFDPDALVDDGTCNFVAPCDYLVYDGNNDGFVGSGDLLGLLTEFGFECDIFD